jgi:SAM-dependent methyltransferase
MLLSGELRRLWYAVWIRLKGLDLGGVSVEELGLSPALAVGHSNSGGPTLEAVLERACIPAGSRIIDLGCGKGGAAFTMTKFPFAEIVGVEICPQLVAVAKENRRRLQLDSRIQFLCSDATVFTELDRFTHVYLFNPFAPEIVKGVCANLFASLQRRPRTLTLICKYPEGSIDSSFPESGQLNLLAKWSFKFSHPFYLFSLTV